MSTDANRFKKLPPLSSHPVDVGRRSEAAVVGELNRRGFNVLVPTTVNARYDLVVDFGDHFARVQVKTGRYRDGVIDFPTVSTRSNRSGVFRRDYKGEIDYFAIYCFETEQAYLVPIEDLPVGKGCLRVTPTRNAQEQGVRWARDYELPPLGT